MAPLCGVWLRQGWNRVRLREETNRLRDSTDSFKDWILTAITSLSVKKIQVMAAVIDGVWFERNKRIWREEETPSFVVARKAMEAAKEWSDNYAGSESSSSGRRRNVESGTLRRSELSSATLTGQYSQTCIFTGRNGTP
ncbi:hypothetical protein LINPERHAP2_LOCUS4503 [Linum perenne]